ncbi:MAG TPA: hypothetical protein VF032_01220 [Thermoleophilaceae bacterium]
MNTLVSTVLAAGEPAKGAPIGDVIWGTAAATAATALVIWVAMAHRAGRISWLQRVADFSSRVSGLPPWTALPGAITGASLIVAGFGFYWDVAKHIDTGRDPGPFGTVAHYPILIGLFGITIGGFTAIVLGTGKGVPTSLRIADDWRAPLGGVLIFLCGAFALSGFPLDDVWHTLFGQDVTLWGPTHVLMIGGASLSALGVWVLLVEGRRALGWSEQQEREQPLWLRLRTTMIVGGFLVGLSTLQGEFDYGVPQFQLVFQPIMIMFAAGVGLVAARVRLGRFGALQAVASFLVVRGLFTLVIGPVFGLSTLHMPLYLAEAIVVELAALAIPRAKPLTLGVAAGGLIGTVGLAAEWGWSHVWMPLPWPSAMLPEAAILGFAAALAGGVIGGYLGRALLSGDVAPQRGPRWLLPAAAVVALFCIAFPLPMDSGSPARATVALTTAQGGPHRTANATIKISPASAAAHHEWLTMTAWQGGALQVDRLKQVGPDTWRTTQPVPVYGKWKSMLRLENGRGVRAVPVYLPEDPAIPAKGVPAKAHFTRPFVRDKKILQREAVGGSTWLATPAYLLLLAIAAMWLLSLGWGLRRLEQTAGEPVRGDVSDRTAGASQVRGKVRTA